MVGVDDVGGWVKGGGDASELLRLLDPPLPGSSDARRGCCGWSQALSGGPCSDWMA